MKAGRNSGAISGSSDSIETEVCSPAFLNLFSRYQNRVAKILRLHVFGSRFGQSALHFLWSIASAGISIHQHVDREERGGNRTCPVFSEKELLDSDPASAVQCFVRLFHEDQAFIDRKGIQNLTQEHEVVTAADIMMMSFARKTALLCMGLMNDSWLRSPERFGLPQEQARSQSA